VDYQLDYTIFFLPTAHRKNNLNDTQVTSLNHTSTQTSPRGVVDIASDWNVLGSELNADEAHEDGECADAESAHECETDRDEDELS
jgi:hypothetical protein